MKTYYCYEEVSFKENGVREVDYKWFDKELISIDFPSFKTKRVPAFDVKVGDEKEIYYEEGKLIH